MSDPFHYESDAVQGTGYGAFTTAATPPSTGRRRRHSSGSQGSHLPPTPRTAFSALGQRRRSIGNTEHIELDSLDKTDPFEHHYSEVRFGTGSFSESIQQDISLLRSQGFIIDYPNGLLGTGFYGSVYKGVYGPNVSNQIILLTLN